MKSSYQIQLWPVQLAVEKISTDLLKEIVGRDWQLIKLIVINYVINKTLRLTQL